MAAPMNVQQLAGWLPIQICWRPSGPAVDWCYVGDRRLTAPFYEQTIGRCLDCPGNLLFRHETPLDALAELYAARPGLQPRGFIFHMSRCGSTLVSQMLAALPQNLVVSEAGPINAVLHANLRDARTSAETQITWLRWVVSALGQPRGGQEQHYFIKFDSWHTLYLPLIQRAFPEVPWVFVYREPVEVIVSNLRERAGRTVPRLPEAAILGVDPIQALQMPPEEYCALVIGRYCQVAWHCHPSGKLVNHRQLPEIVFSALLPHFRVEYPPDDLLRMRQVSQFNAKSPGTRFADDSSAKQAEATAAVRLAADKWVRPFFDKLEAARSQQTA
ncbi:MAG: sulfotransferase [Planctomycetota bacterium]